MTCARDHRERRAAPHAGAASPAEPAPAAAGTDGSPPQAGNKAAKPVDTAACAAADIEDYALLSDCHCAALVSRDGSVDWCCMPRFDDDSCFGRLLDWERGGHCSIRPWTSRAASHRSYLPGTMVLETGFATEDAEIVLIDFLAVSGAEAGSPRHVRIVEGRRGEMDVDVHIVPRFEYGQTAPDLRHVAAGVHIATGGNRALIVQADGALEIEGNGLRGRWRIRAGERSRLVMRFAQPQHAGASSQEGALSERDIDQDLEATVAWWRAWAAQARDDLAPDAQTLRSLLVLKSLTYTPTGAVIAAPTTSLPESPGGTRNWDYRYSWVRDSVFMVRALELAGYSDEADGFHRFITRSCAGSAEQLQIMYGIDGRRRLPETELPELAGYHGARPVRTGNRAARQRQNDVFGHLVLMAWQWHLSGHAIDEDYWNFLRRVVDATCDSWELPDHGIWEIRDEPRQFVHSKAMCWAAVDRGIELAGVLGAEAPLARWRAARDRMREAIETQGYDRERGVFTQAFGFPHMDASLLLLPRIGFLPYDDPRMLRTTDAICRELDQKGLLRRYRAPDGLPDDEGVFLACTFWLVGCLALQGRAERALPYYRRAMACANDVGLFAEEFDIADGHLLGNFPLGLTHVSQIAAHMALSGIE